MATPSTQREVIDQVYARAMKALRVYENKDVLLLNDAYQRAQAEILAVIHPYVIDGSWDLQTMQRTGRLQALLDSINHTLFGLQQEQNELIQAGNINQFNGAYKTTVYAMDQATPDNIAISYAPPPMDSVKLLVNTPYKGAMFSQRIGIITNAMASDVRDELLQSMIQGEGMDAAAKRVVSVIGLENPDNPRSYLSRARTIARSEIMRAQNLAREFTFSQNKDVVDDQEWLVTPDDKLCKWCMRRDGMTDEEIEAAPTSYDGKEDPWQNSADCPLHPNCRCAKIPRLKSWKDLIGLDMPERLPDDYRGMRSEGGDWILAPVQTFDNWLAARQIEPDLVTA